MVHVLQRLLTAVPATTTGARGVPGSPRPAPLQHLHLRLCDDVQGWVFEWRRLMVVCVVCSYALFVYPCLPWRRQAFVYVGVSVQHPCTYVAAARNNARPGEGCVLHGECRTVPATLGNHSNEQSSRGQPQAAVRA